VDPKVILPLLTSVLAFAFAVLVFDQWLRRRRAYQLVWTIGLAWYGIAAGAEFVGGAFGWNEALYRSWYLFGALGVAAFLGLGTIYLLNRTRFGYFVAFSVLVGGLVSVLSAMARAREGDPVAAGAVIAVVAASTAAAVVVGVVTRTDRRLVAPVAASIVGAAWAFGAWLTFAVPVEPPGYALAVGTGVPIGEALPGELRIVTPPFNITGGFALVFGAFYSMYIFMPKRRVLRLRSRIPLLDQLARAVTVTVNLVASLPATARALADGRLNSRVPATFLIAIGGFIPGWTDALSRYGITWAFFLGQFLGIVLIFLGFLVSIEVFSDVRLPFTRIVLTRRERGARNEAGEAGSRV
jgi:hypothetical protein